jgi:hypothetical protein
LFALTAFLDAARDPARLAVSSAYRATISLAGAFVYVAVNSAGKVMDSVTAAVMVVLSCSPDMMLCREPASKPTLYATSSDCRQALSRKLAEARRDNRKLIGRCDESNLEGRWGISPNGELFSARIGDVVTVAEPRVGAPMPPARKGPVTVRVTRGTVTTAYTVTGTLPY